MARRPSMQRYSNPNRLAHQGVGVGTVLTRPCVQQDNDILDGSIDFVRLSSGQASRRLGLIFGEAHERALIVSMSQSDRCIRTSTSEPGTRRRRVCGKLDKKARRAETDGPSSDGPSFSTERTIRKASVCIRRSISSSPTGQPGLRDLNSY
jgi:hypothetical protein